MGIGISGLKKRLLPITIGVTGHIDISPADESRAEQEVSDLIEKLHRRFPNSPLRLLTSLAEGADRIAARAFLRKKAEIASFDQNGAKDWEMVVPLPMARNLYVADFANSVEEFDELLAASTFSFSLPVRPEHRPSDIATPGEARNFQYQDASRFVASHSDILIAVWDGLDPLRKGGTCETVRMRLQGHNVTSRLHYSPLSRSESRLVHHIRASRVQDTGQHLETADLVGHDHYSASIEKTMALSSDLKEIDDYNAAVNRLVNDIMFTKSLNYSLGDAVRDRFLASEIGYSAQTCLETFATADALAIYYEYRWRLTTKIIYGLGLGTAMLLPLAIEGMFMPWAMMGYFGLLGIAFGILLFMHRGRLENRHIESRALAELLRVQFAWIFSGIEDHSSPANRHSASEFMIPMAVTQILLGQQQVDLGWINPVMSHLVLVKQRENGLLSGTTFDGLAIVRDWIHGQSRYFSKKAAQAEELAERFRRISVCFVIGGLSSALGAILLSFVGHELEWLRHILVVLSAALPVGGFVLENASERFGIEAQARIRERLHEVYEKSAELLERPNLDPMTRDRLIIETGREAVAEAIMWLFLRRIKPVKVSM